MSLVSDSVASEAVGTSGVRVRVNPNMNHVFRLVNPVYNRNPYIFKVRVVPKQAKYE